MGGEHKKRSTTSKDQLSFDTLSISKELANEIKKYKNIKKTISLVQVDKAALEKKLPISNKDVKEYLSKPENKDTVKKLFEQRKSSFNSGRTGECSSHSFKDGWKERCRS